MVIETAGGKHKLPFAAEFRILGHLFSRDGGLQISLEKMQSANKAWWRDAKIYHCKRSVPWETRCQREFDRVFSVFCSGCDNWSCGRATMDRIKGREMKILRR